ncbi:MAG: enoyl-CoA hydratase/isomerase family protein [Deltaproteobacteria bacterium]|nr:enoyl-CoA hydratase/isomerase family protein [Deltaproteobacteria bacterium]MBW1923704.1 enoyl-CoA hydratase/isomerase family protein [Deltaproteobacteria bacterium]MBW1950309.1 enoyl-CoA hydratase/isomerase family protein [Deltaproteobacteria bacterium]MBW2008389.1 enoyl-CoA hydratase/isomerase family protein [Deltaproteobacteria bacterium]MBW2347742.1 enoyl-CoA hydratase/isomerase family protein [Deltaproteobacteria bacterium]
MSEKTVLMEKEEPVCRLTMNRPNILNAFNGAMGTGLFNALQSIAGDPEVRVVILQGAGEHFSSGADMHLLAEGTDPPTRLRMMKNLSRLIIAMRELPQPIICKVRGVAYGVGSNLALAGDFVVASETARICEVFINIGVIMDGGGHYFLPRLVGLHKARELAMLGEEISGRQAEAMGLIYKSVPDQDLDRETDMLAQKLASKSPMAMAVIKEGLERSLNMPLQDVMEWEASHQSIMLQTREHKEAVEFFLASRDKKKGG